MLWIHFVGLGQFQNTAKYFTFLLFVSNIFDPQNAKKKYNNLFEPIICIFQFLELNQHFQISTSRTFWSSYIVQYFENYWSNTEGMDTRIGHIIKINNDQKKNPQIENCFSSSGKQHHNLLLKEKGVLLQNL